MPLQPTITEVARFQQDCTTTAHRITVPFVGIVDVETVCSGEDPDTGIIEIPIEIPVLVGHTIIVQVLWKDRQGIRPFFTRSSEYIEDWPGLDGEPQRWTQDPLPTPGAIIAGDNPGYLELWSIRPEVDQPDGAVIRVKEGCKVLHALHIDQVCHPQTFDVPPEPDHTHVQPGEPQFRHYTSDYDLEILPILAVGGFSFERYSWHSTLGIVTNYDFPLETFALESQDVAYEHLEGHATSILYLHSGDRDSSINSTTTEAERWTLWPGHRIFLRPTWEVGQDVHLSGVRTLVEAPPGWPGYPGYLTYPWTGQVGFYTVRFGTAGRRWLFNLATRHGWYLRADCQDGNVWVRRVRGLEPPFESEVQVTSSGQDSRPVLYLEAISERLWLLFGREEEGVYRCYSDDDGETWSTPTMAIPGGRFPFAIVEPCSGNTVEAAYVAGFLKGRRITSGGEVGAIQTFVDETGEALSVEEDTFGLAWHDDSQARLIGVFSITGEDSASEWRNTDGGEYFRWTRVS